MRSRPRICTGTETGLARAVDEPPDDVSHQKVWCLLKISFQPNLDPSTPIAFKLRPSDDPRREVARTLTLFALLA